VQPISLKIWQTFHKRQTKKKKTVKICLKLASYIPPYIHRTGAHGYFHKVDEDVMAVCLDTGTFQQDVSHLVLPHLFEQSSDGRHEDVETVEVELRVQRGHFADVIRGETDGCAGLQKEFADLFLLALSLLIHFS